MWKREKSTTNETNKQFFKNAGFIAVTEIIAKLKALIILPLLTHHFGALNYGVWSQVSVLVGTISPLIILGTDSAVLRYLPGRPIAEQRSCFYTWSVFILLISFLAGFFIYILENPITHVFFGNKTEYTAYIPLALASLLATIIINQSRTWFRINNEGKKYALINFMQSILSIGSVVLIMIRGEGVYQLVSYNVIIDFVLGIGSWSLIISKYGLGKLEFSIIPTLLKFGVPLVPAGFAMWGLNSMDRLFLVKYSTLAEIGIYSVVYSLGYLVIQIIVNPIWAMFPNYAAELYNQQNMRQLQEIFQQSISTITFFAFPAIVGLGIVGKVLVSVLTTAEFHTGSCLIPVIAIGYLCSIYASYYEVLLGLAYRQYYATLSITVTFLLNLVLNIILIPRYSITGAAFATAAAFLSEMLISRSIANKYIKLKVNTVFIAKVVLATTIMAGALLLVRTLLDLTCYAYLITFTSMGIVIYFILAWWMKMLPSRTGHNQRKAW